jgi:Ca2+-binding RTX toxin-like protein
LRTLVLLVAIGAAIVVPATAQGATVAATGFSGGLDVKAAAGEANSMTIAVAPPGPGGAEVTVSDAGAALGAGDGCASEPSGDVSCTIPGLYIVFVHLFDLDDSLTVDNGDAGAQFTIDAGEGGDEVAVGPRGEVCLDGGPGDDRLAITTPSMACTVDGDDGDDVLTGSAGLDRLYGGDGVDLVNGRGGADYVYGDAGNDTVNGGPGDDVRVSGGDGNDHLYGAAGADYLEDGPGDDQLRGGPGNDSLNSTFFFDSGDDAYLGGPGHDRFTYFCPRCRVSIDGVANDGRPGVGEADNVDVEAVSTPSRIPPDPDEGDPGHNYGSGRDVLVGGAADETFVSHRGDDRLTGGGGSDRLVAGFGDDTVLAADGVADALVDCGPGDDTAIVDPLDSPQNCEHVTVQRPGNRGPSTAPIGGDPRRSGTPGR